MEENQIEQISMVEKRYTIMQLRMHFGYMWSEKMDIIRLSGLILIIKYINRNCVRKWGVHY